jgi:hypothetical protein
MSQSYTSLPFSACMAVAGEIYFQLCLWHNIYVCLTAFTCDFLMYICFILVMKETNEKRFNESNVICLFNNAIYT